MEVTGSADEGFVREWTPCSHILNLIPTRVQNGLFSNELCLTCVDAVSDYIALGTNVGLVYWYDRKKGNIQRLRCEASTSPITYVKIVNTVDYMVGAGNSTGQVTVFQIPKEHPDNIPDAFKPKTEPKVERYTIGDLHKSKITAIEWSKNGMRLFSGDINGVIIMTEIDFYMHLCKSMEIVNEEYEIVQISHHQNYLLVSSVYRSIVCERKDSKWHVSQLGKKDRKSLCALGAVFQYSYSVGGAATAYCARAGLRLWRADVKGNVLQTLLFKDAISNPVTVAELLNPSRQKHHVEDSDNLGVLYVFREHYLVSHNHKQLFVMDPRTCTALAVVDDFRKILSACVNRDEIFVLEGPRSLVRLAHSPEPATLATDETVNLMTKSLTTSIQQAVNHVRDLTHIDQTVPYITSVLEQPISMFTNNEHIDNTVTNAEECFELPPVKKLPKDISENVLESIVKEFQGVSEVDEIRRLKTEEIQRKLKIYNSIMERKCGEELIHSRRSRRRDGDRTPRLLTPVRKDVSYTSPCVMNVSVYSNMPQETDDALEKQIEEKEKILAKMLSLESLGISIPKPPEHEEVTETAPREIPLPKPLPVSKPIVETVTVQTKVNSNSIGLVPKVVQLPNNWNLDSLQLNLDVKSNVFKDLASPDDTIDAEWEIV